MTCPGSAPSGGATGPFDDPNADQPFSAPSWRQLAPGEIRHSDPASKTIAPAVSTPAPGQAYDYIHNQFGMVGVIAAALLLFVAGLSVIFYFDRRK